MKAMFTILFVLNFIFWVVWGSVLNLGGALICLGNVFDEMAQTKNPP